MTPRSPRRCPLLIAAGFSLACVTAAAFHVEAAPPKSATTRRSRGDTSSVLVVVNGIPITENQLAFYLLVHQIAEGHQPEVRRKIVEQLVDNELIRQFLADRKADVDPKRLATISRLFKEGLRRRNLDPDQTLKRLGYNEATLRRDLGLPLAWERHFERAVTQQQIRDEFERHRNEYDGTEIRASQIFIKLSKSEAGPPAKEAEEKLAKIRSEIVAGTISFAAAAKKYSEAPSRENGGDVGYFAYRGKMPPEICRVAFSLKPGEVSQPFRTEFGMHLYTATDRRPGDLSLEDVRPLLLQRISNELWHQLLAEARAKATIEWRGAH